MSKLQIILMTDLDGTLLDHDNFGYESVKSFMIELIHAGIKIIPNSSKTSEELEYFCAGFGQRLAYVSENGAALQYLDLLSDSNTDERSTSKIFGRSVSELTTVWTSKIPIALRNQCLFLDEVDQLMQSRYLGLTEDALDRAMKRNYSRPFIFKGSDDDFYLLKKEANKLDLNVLRGGRVCNLSGLHDKADSISIVRDLVQPGEDELVIIGLGDGDNDIGMLSSCDIACVIPRKNYPPISIDKTKACKRVIHASQVAPLGWQEAVESAIAFLKIEYRYSYG